MESTRATLELEGNIGVVRIGDASIRRTPKLFLANTIRQILLSKDGDHIAYIAGDIARSLLMLVYDAAGDTYVYSEDRSLLQPCDIAFDDGSNPPRLMFQSGGTDGVLVWMPDKRRWRRAGGRTENSD